MFTQDTARYTTLSLTCVLPLQHTASLRTSQRYCRCMSKKQGSWNFFHAKLIPNSSITYNSSSFSLSSYKFYIKSYLSADSISISILWIKRDNTNNCFAILFISSILANYLSLPTLTYPVRGCISRYASIRYAPINWQQS